MTLCDICHGETFRRRFTPATGWTARHEKCEPQKALLDRHRNGRKAPMSYVPRSLPVADFVRKGPL